MVQNFEFEKTDIDGVWIIKAFNAEDIRGDFTKDYSDEIFKNNGIKHEIKEIFYTRSHAGVIRALHFQRVKQQSKLVRCVKGRIWDVVVDLRSDSPTFKKWLAFELSDDENREILIPGGCAHGYLILEESIVSYKCDEKFYAEFDDGIIWNDKTINVKWPLKRIGGCNKLILAEKDKKLQSFEEFVMKYKGLL